MPRILHQTLTVVCCLAVALMVSWKMLHAANYGYSFWYDQLDIAAHIDRFAPQNRQGKTGFENTSRADHEALFTAIGIAVNNDGKGLRELSYRASPNTEMILLTEAEAVHLEDVAILINRLMPFGWAALALLIVLVITAQLMRWPLPGPTVSLATIALIAIAIAIVILIVGAGPIFTALHEAVFPADHQWFFYYQDSLMTTLMKAPDIFFAIGAVWGVLSALVFITLALGLRLLAAREPAAA